MEVPSEEKAGVLSFPGVSLNSTPSLSFPILAPVSSCMPALTYPLWPKGCGAWLMVTDDVGCDMEPAGGVIGMLAEGPGMIDGCAGQQPISNSFPFWEAASLAPLPGAVLLPVSSPSFPGLKPRPILPLLAWRWMRVGCSMLQGSGCGGQAASVSPLLHQKPGEGDVRIWCAPVPPGSALDVVQLSPS